MVNQVTKRGEVILSLDKEVRKAGEKGTKRSRNQSLSEDIKREIKKKKNSESVEVREIVNVEKPDTAIDNVNDSVELA